jgi:hypothetical protein
VPLRFASLSLIAVTLLASPVCAMPPEADEPGAGPIEITTSPDLTLSDATTGPSSWALPADPGPVNVEIGMFFNFRYIATVAPNADEPNDDWTYGFNFRRLRPDFTFETFDGRLGVYMQTEAARSQLEVLDLYTFLEPVDNWRFRLGRFRLNFTRETSVSSRRQIAVDRTSLTNNVLPGDSVRVTGLEARYTEGPNRVWFTLSEGTGTDLTSFNDPRPQWGVTLRGERLLIGEGFRQWRQMTAPRETPEGLLWGLAGHIQHLGDNGMMDGQGTRWAATTDLSYQNDGFSVSVAGMIRGAEDLNEQSSVEPENIHGFTAIVGYYLTNEFEPFARYEWASTSDPDHTELSVLTFGANYYLVGQLVKFTTDFSIAFDGIGPTFGRTSDGLLVPSDAAVRYLFRSQFTIDF